MLLTPPIRVSKGTPSAAAVATQAAARVGRRCQPAKLAAAGSMWAKALRA